MTGYQHLFDGRLRSAPHAYLLPHHLPLLPASLELVAGAVGRVQPLDEQVVLVNHGRRDAPGDALVVTDDDGRHPRQADARRPQAGRLQVGLVPDAGDAQGQVGVVGQQRPAGGRLGAVHDPVVAGAAPGHGQGQLPELGQDVRPHPPRRGAGRQHQGLVGGIEGLQFGQHLGAEAFQEPGAQHLPVPVAREGPGHEAPDGQRVGHLPGLGAVAEQQALQGWAATRQPGVHAGGEGLQRLPHLRLQTVHVAPRHPADSHPPHQAVVFQGGLPQHLGQGARGQPPVEVQLPEAVLGLDVAQGEEEVPQVAGVDVGDAPAVAQDLDLLAQAHQPRLPLQLGRASPQQAIGQGCRPHAHGGHEGGAPQPTQGHSPHPWLGGLLLTSFGR